MIDSFWLEKISCTLRNLVDPEPVQTRVGSGYLCGFSATYETHRWDCCGA